MNAPKIIFFDIDETLYRKRSNYLPESVNYAIRALKKRGIIPAIATGRSLAAIPEKIHELSVAENIELFVTINGQYNQYRGQAIDAHCMERADIERFIALFQQHSWDYTFVGSEQMASSSANPRVCEALATIGPFVVDADYYQRRPVYQILLFIDAEEEVHLNASGELAKGYHAMRWHPFSVDLLQATGSKARGIRAVCEKLGVSPSETMAFGDGENDVEMFKTVGYGVAMGDACPQLLAVADRQTGTVEEDGIYHALVQLGVIEAM
ncbi:MAG: Cof-type HAD-IIB family hydrolase [Cardiobacteriaceae bacterium]|nr:Cof-type HAD-IIB family hydrolase [Cardiobacteriaceae bacterium]